MRRDGFCQRLREVRAKVVGLVGLLSGGEALGEILMLLKGTSCLRLCCYDWLGQSVV